MIGLKFTYTIGVKIVDKYTFFSVVAFTYLRLNTSSLWNDIYFAVLILINKIKDVGIKFAYFCKWCNILNLNSSKIRSTFSLNFPVSAIIICFCFFAFCDRRRYTVQCVYPDSPECTFLIIIFLSRNSTTVFRFVSLSFVVFSLQNSWIYSYFRNKLVQHSICHLVYGYSVCMMALEIPSPTHSSWCRFFTILLNQSKV